MNFYIILRLSIIPQRNIEIVSMISDINLRKAIESAPNMSIIIIIIIIIKIIIIIIIII
jgi:hypothetical protein